MDLEIITDSPGSITFENIESIQPFEVKDSLIVARDNHIFKEFIYAAEKVYTTLFIEVKKAKRKHLHNPIVKHDAHNTSNVNISKLLVDNDEENKTLLMSSYYDIDQPEIYKEKEKEHLRLTLEISHSNRKIYKTDFFESIIIPNILFEGTPIPYLDENPKAAKKGGGVGIAAHKQDKKDLFFQDQQSPETGKEKENTPYSITCVVDMSEAPSWIKSEEIEWNIRVFSSDTLAFVKDTSKELKEKSLKDSWEINEPGRALKAKFARFKYILEHKFTQNENLNKEEAKFLEYFKQAEGNISRIPQLQLEEQDKLEGGSDTINIEETQGNKAGSNKIPVSAKKGAAVASKDKKEKECKNVKNANNKSVADNLNNTKDQSVSILIHPNNNVNINESVNLISIKDEINNVNFNKNGNNKIFVLSPINSFDNWNYFKNLTSKRIRIQDKDCFKSPEPKPQANFIKDFIGYVDEDRTKIIKNNMIESNENYNKTRGLFFNIKEKKVDQKLSKSTGLSEFFERHKMKIQFDLKTIREKQDKNIKTFFQKTNTAIKNIKNEKSRLMKIREDFRLTFNNTKDTEAKIFELLESDKEGLNLEQVILMYKQIIVTEHKSSTITKIHSIISKRKEESILKLLDKNMFNKETAMKAIEEIKFNKWDVSEHLVKKLNEILIGK